ncbi:putative anthocyanidin reductase isoform X2 [Elaeis guineensis]|uniref:Anthocyanidin reductase isoform X2 n=1 Tax=Elaeis guineensis var. tenera TaxID=51953 RepID=A0A6I9RTZ8_ELAGV|nr:putative anthocyanidin reductase isoform X2 [Elaeis guineensis]
MSIGSGPAAGFRSLEGMDGADSPSSPSAVATTTVCVTGATGYIGSWLVRSLLRRGYNVHATARDTGKASRLLSTFSGNSGLKIFRSDLNEEGSFDEAVKGCLAVFHVAASMEFNVPVEENIDHVRSKITEPAVRGTLNVLQACSRAGSVKRIVFTSSISTITAKDDKGEWRELVDESSVTPINGVWNTKPRGWVYILSKLLTEEKAFQFAKEKCIDLVSIIPPTVAGPFLTTDVPASVQVLLSPVTGDPNLYPILVSVHSRLGSIPLVHIEDICNAHIFLMEQQGAEGKFLCSVGSSTLPQLTDLLSLEYPYFSSERFAKGFHNAIPPVISSKRLTNLGFKFKYGVKDIIEQSVACCIKNGFLKCPITEGINN